MHGVGWRGWALAFSAALLAHAGLLMLVLKQEPEPDIRPDPRPVTVFLGQIGGIGGAPPTEIAESPVAETVSAGEGAAEVPPREAATEPPERAPLTSPETAASTAPENVVALAAPESDLRIPSEEATTTPPETAASASPENAVALDALDADTRPPSEEAISAPAESATPASPEEAPALDAADADTRLPSEEATATPPETVAAALPEDAVALAALDAGAHSAPREVMSTPPEPATATPPEDAVAPAAIETGRLPPTEEAAPAPPEPAGNPPQSSIAEPARFIEPESAVSDRASPELVPLELAEAAGVAMLDVDPQDFATIVLNANEAAAAPALSEVAQPPPPPATLPTPEEAIALPATEAERASPPREAAPTPPETAAPPPPEDAGVLTVGNDAERPPPEEAVTIASEPVAPPALEEAEVLTAVESAGPAQIEEAISAPPAREASSSLAPEPAPTPVRGSVAEPVPLVAADSVDSAHVSGDAEPVEIVDSTEPATSRAGSRESVAEVSVIDEATTAAPPRQATSTPPPPAESAPLEEAEVLAATEATGSLRVDVAVPASPVPTEVVGPTEEVVMRTVADPMAPTSTSPSPGAQETQPPPQFDEEPGAAPGSGDDGVFSAGRIAYLARVQDWLLRHLQYPHVARTRAQTGTALLYIELDRTGNVKSSEIRTSSGHDLLDREVLEMVRRAKRLPAIPEHMREERLELLVNIEFVLQ